MTASRLLTPFRVAGHELANRTFTAPMRHYSAENGCMTDILTVPTCCPALSISVSI